MKIEKLSEKELEVLKRAVLSGDMFAQMMQQIHQEGKLLDPETGAVLPGGSPMLLALFEKALGLAIDCGKEAREVLGPCPEVGPMERQIGGRLLS